MDVDDKALDAPQRDGDRPRMPWMPAVVIASSAAAMLGLLVWPSKAPRPGRAAPQSDRVLAAAPRLAVRGLAPRDIDDARPDAAIEDLRAVPGRVASDGHLGNAPDRDTAPEGAAEPADVDPDEGVSSPIARAFVLEAALSLALDAAPSSQPPAFADVEEEIAWTRRAWARARAERDARAEFVARAQRRRDAMASADPDPGRRAAFERRYERVVANHDRAQARVAELEAHLARLSPAE